jgi:hypothetical protein
MEFNEILNDFDIPIPGAQTEKEEESGNDESVDNSSNAIEDKLSKIFEGRKTGTEQTSDEKKPADAEKKQEPPKEEGEDKKPAESTENIDFSESSKRAFFNETGDLDTEKVGDYFLNSSKHSIPIDSVVDEPIDKKLSKETEENTDPEIRYTKEVSEIASSLPKILEEEKRLGFTPEQTLQRLINTMDGLKRGKESSLAMKAAMENTAKEWKSEVEQIREDKIKTRISQNTMELSHHYENLIPGKKGYEVLNKFMLDKKYGGKVLDAWFLRDNKNFSDLSEEEKESTTLKWFKNFQTSKKSMAVVAEFGRAMWVMEQLPEILKHAQNIGAKKVSVEKEAKAGKPSGILPKSTSQSSRLTDFFDSVN